MRRRPRTSRTRKRTGRPRGSRTRGASSATAARCRCRAVTVRTGCWSTDGASATSASGCRASTSAHVTFCIGSLRESPARHHVFPARGRRRRPTAAEAGDPFADARDRDPRARARRSEVAAPRRGAPAAHAGLVHRARYLGPKARLPSEELRGLTGVDLALAQARLAGRRLLLPDASVTWAPTAIPAAVRIVRNEGIDAIITTSPPLSMNLIGASVKKLTGVPWIADQRDSLVLNADRRFEKKSVQAKEKALERVVKLVADRADGIVAVSEPIADELRGFNPSGPVRVIPNGCDF